MLADDWNRRFHSFDGEVKVAFAVNAAKHREGYAESWRLPRTAKLSSCLTAEHFNGSSTFTTIDTFVIEIDPFNRPTVAGKVDGTSTGSFRESVTHWGCEGFIVSEGYNHIGNFDRRIPNPHLKLFKPAFASADIDSIVIIPEIHLTLT